MKLRWVNITVCSLGGLLLAGCMRAPNSPVVMETYVQKYGVVVPENDWKSRGEQGQVISHLKNGIIQTRTYDRGVLHGDVTLSFPHSDIVEKKEVYVKGELQKAINYSIGGLPLKQVCYLPNQRREVTIWYENGVPCSVELFAESGDLTEAAYFDTHHEQDSQVLHGDGVRLVRDMYGQLIAREQISGGELLMRTTYHSNGSLKEEIPFVNGVIEGVVKTYLPNGEPNTQEEWISGKQEGITTVYQNGYKFAEVPYVQGVRCGIERRFGAGSTVVEEVTWRDNLRHGATLHYVGGTCQEEWYYRGEATSKLNFDKMQGLFSS